MKMSWRVIAAVVGAHGAALAMVLLIQGCGRTAAPIGSRSEPIMPPASVAETPVAVRVPPKMPVAPPDARTWPAETTIYVVEKGDSLSRIAVRFGLDVSDIVSLNKLRDANTIRLGQRLVLPGKIDIKAVPRPAPVAPPAKPVAKPAPPASDAGDGRTHMVQTGDSLSALAVRYGVSVKALKEANGVTSDTIRVGQKLVVPPGRKAGTREVSAPAREPLDAPPAPATPAVGKPSPPSAGEAPPTAGADSPVPRIHIVQPREDAYTVAMMWGVSLARLKEVNRLGDDVQLKAGQRLIIPLD